MDFSSIRLFIFSVIERETQEENFKILDVIRRRSILTSRANYCGICYFVFLSRKGGELSLEGGGLHVPKG